MSKRRKSRKARKSRDTIREKKTPSPKSDFKKSIKEEQGYVCPICGQIGTDRTMDIHHKKPKARGGKNTRDNLVAWHKTCHKNFHHRHGLKTCDDQGRIVRPM